MKLAAAERAVRQAHCKVGKVKQREVKRSAAGGS